MLSPSKRRTSPSKTNETSTNSRSPTKILSTLRTLIWSPSKGESKENEEINPTPSKKQRTDTSNSFITSSPQRQNQRGASPSLTPKKKPVRNLAADFEEYERKDTEKDILSESSLQNFVSEHFGEDKENFLQSGLAPSKSQSSKSLLNTLFSPMFKQYSSFFGTANSIQESGNITITEKVDFQVIGLGSNEEEEADDDDALNKTICYEDESLNESTTSEDSEHGSLQVKVLGLASNEKLSDFHYTRETRTVNETKSTEITYYVQQESFEESEEDEESEEFDPFLFIATLPPLPIEYRQRPAALPAKHSSHPKLTLVLDLDETLVHCSTDPMEGAELVFPVVFNEVEYRVYVRKRPYFEQFLEAVSKHFEVVVFTASQEVYASKLLDIIDRDKKHIHHRLYRQSCVNVDGNFLKDLSILGRDLSQVVIVDNSPQTFAYQLDNGIPIESWFDDPSDQELSKLLPFLFELKNVEDVRPHVRERFKLHEKIDTARKNNKK